MEEQVRQATAILRQGGVVVYPTDTLYGLGALATIDVAVERVFRLKRRPPDKALPLLISKADEMEALAIASPRAWAAARRFWPGALTIVLPKALGFHSLALAGGDTVALRVPNHPVALALIAGAGGPITGTSANVSEGPGPVTAQEAHRQLGDAVDMYIDAGPCPGGVGSTVLDLTGPRPVILRPGTISRQEIEETLGQTVGVRGRHANSHR